MTIHDAGLLTILLQKSKKVTMPICVNSTYATILNIGSYSSSIFSMSGLDAEFKKICLMTNRLNPRLARACVRAKLNADSFIAVGLKSSSHEAGCVLRQ